MALFSNNNYGKNAPPSQRDVALRRYHTARVSLLLLVALTLMNIIFLIVDGGETYFLFSCSIPYILPLISFVDPELATLLIPLAIVGILLVVPYVLAFIFSSKTTRYGWMVGALVLFIIDTIVFFLMMFSIDFIIDLLFHGWAIVEMVIAIIAARQINAMPPEEAAPVEFVEIGNANSGSVMDGVAPNADSANFYTAPTQEQNTTDSYTSAEDARNQNEK